MSGANIKFPLLWKLVLLFEIVARWWSLLICRLVTSTLKKWTVCTWILDTFLPFRAATAPNEPRFPHYRGIMIVLRHTHSRYYSSGRVISSTQRPLPDNTQHSQQTDMHAPPGGIRTHNPSKRAAADQRLRPRGHWDRRIPDNTVS